MKNKVEKANWIFTKYASECKFLSNGSKWKPDKNPNNLKANISITIGYNYSYISRENKIKYNKLEMKILKE